MFIRSIAIFFPLALSPALLASVGLMGGAGVLLQTAHDLLDAWCCHKACGTSTERHQVKAATMDATIMWMRVPHAGGKPMADSLVKSKSANLKQSS